MPTAALVAPLLRRQRKRSGRPLPLSGSAAASAASSTGDASSAVASGSLEPTGTDRSTGCDSAAAATCSFGTAGVSIAPTALGVATSSGSAASMTGFGNASVAGSDTGSMAGGSAAGLAGNCGLAEITGGSTSRAADGSTSAGLASGVAAGSAVTTVSTDSAVADCWSAAGSAGPRHYLRRPRPLAAGELPAADFTTTSAAGLDFAAATVGGDGARPITAPR